VDEKSLETVIMALDWQKQLSFTERFTNLAEITKAFSAMHADSASDASAVARELESTVYKESASLVEYQTRCEAVLKELVSIAPPEEIETVAEETADEVAERILAQSTEATKFGRYKPVAHFASGLFSAVYVCRRIDDTQAGAASSIGSASKYTLEVSKTPGDQDVKSSFMALKATNLSATKPPHDAAREARIILRAASPHVMPLLEHFYDGLGHLVLVMPFTPFTLEQLLGDEDTRRLQVPKDTTYIVPMALKRALRDLFRALAYIHPLGIIHRDIKPSNILLSSPTGPAYLADFGIAWCASDGASEPAATKISDVGTTCYRAPEVLFGDTRYSEKLDMWAAGCVVAETLLGGSRTLFEGGSVGSELTLIMSIFESLGTPNEQNWPVSCRG
jgi:serine/threonine protein kinase